MGGCCVEWVDVVLNGWMGKSVCEVMARRVCIR